MSMERLINVGDTSVSIKQLFVSDVNGVVWDSALVAIHYLAKNEHLVRGEKILDLGSGTGAVSIACGVMGGNVIATDLPDRLDLIRENTRLNKDKIVGEVRIEELDWADGYTKMDKIDLLCCVDCIYYSSSIEPLIKTIREVRAKKTLLTYEIRDIAVSTHCEMADPSSFSNFRNVVIRSSKLEWKVDMEAKTISGKVEHEVEGVCEKNNEVVLDARDLTVERVLWKGVETQFKYQKVNEALGDKLSVTIPSLSKGDRGNLSIFYRTSTSARALQFLSPAQTTDHKGPYLFSQCQAIHARSILPCFDTPAVKSTYSSRVCVPAGLTCLMSAISTGKDTSGQEEWVFSFNQSIPIPSYLIAIVVGVLEEREIGPRSAVWAEPSVVDTAAKEFMETEQFIKAAEEICGEYVWKRYDLVVLPNTFPYGGMENPCLTFVTPTIITGDRSLVSVVAHEIAHSWTGNLVTTANWDHFWLNEGFTVYLERKIIEKVYGKARRFFDSKEGFDSLNDTLKFITPDHSKLRLNLGGIDPDDAFSSIPYEKGSSLLLYLEQEVLSESETLSFLKEHVSLFSQSSLDTETWLDSMYQRYPKMKEKEEIVNQWLYGEGMPPKQPKFLDDSLLVECGKMMDNILSPSPSSHQFSLLTPSQKVFVLNALGDKSPLDHSKLVLLSSDSFGISSSHNCEILCPFIQIGLSSEWEPSIQIALHFAKTYGRLKYCKKTYGLLFAWEKSRQLAIDQFEKEKSNMHPITVQQVESLLNKYK